MAILLEGGGAILLEGGGDLLLESGAAPAPPGPGPGTPPTLTEALEQNHTVASRLEVWQSGQLVTTIGKDSIDYPYLLSGSITAEYDQAVRRTCSVVITDPTGALIPASVLDLLAPFGTEIRLYRGVALGDDITYWSQGVFGLTTNTIHDGIDGRYMTLTGSDRAYIVQKNAWTDAFQIAAGTNVATAIEAIITDRLPTATFSFAPTPAVTPALVLGEQAGNDPWADAQNLAASIGMQLYFDPVGTCTLAAIPDLSAGPQDSAWELADGPDSVFSIVERILTNADTYSGVLVTGETTGNAAPVRALVWDDDPSSATYYLGPYGPRPLIYQSAAATSDDQAESTAIGLLNLNRGAVETVTFTCVPNPSLDMNQVIAVQRPASQIPAGTQYLTSSFTMPLEAQTAMTLVARRTVN